jgi:hypothetical protein
MVLGWGIRWMVLWKEHRSMVWAWLGGHGVAGF